MNTLMVQGTQSNVGKSLLVTALCRYFRRLGFNVAPFKPQNMSLNAAVTAEGGEIGRAQALQAQACGLPPSSLMNPVLIKPHGQMNAQIVINGKVHGRMSARQYHDFKPRAMDSVLASFHRLQAKHPFIIVEGAGSPAEVNLRDRDIANMGFAQAVDCPVLLLADIDPGGVFAQIMGTLQILAESERRRIIGVVINRFRGDRSLFDDGIQWIEQNAGIPVLGVLPFIPDLVLDGEDSMNIPASPPNPSGGDADDFHILVPRLPHLSNHNDFEPFKAVQGVCLTISDKPQPADLIVLPGSKNVMADSAWLIEHWHSALLRHLRYGGRLLGLCAGFQMLGQTIADPHGVESGDAGTEVEGLGLLNFTTTLLREKILRPARGRWCFNSAPVQGYEMHMGESIGPDLRHSAGAALMTEDGERHGVLSADGQIMGCYLHGVFDQPASMQAVLTWAGAGERPVADFEALREINIDRLADCLGDHVNMDLLGNLLGLDAI